MEQPNFSYINKLSKGDKSFEQEVINILKEELSGEIELYFKYVKLGDLKKTKENVHRIKHKMGILGLEKSYEITNDFENQLVEGDFANKKYFESMLPKMTNFLNKL